MDERDFWLKLEYRVCREIDGLRSPTPDLKGLWCDGFIPEQFEAGVPSQYVGRVWMGRGGTHQEQWRFVLLLSNNVQSLHAIDWSTLLPPEDATGWLSLSTADRTTKINPAVARPDSAADSPRYCREGRCRRIQASISYPWDLEPGI